MAVINVFLLVVSSLLILGSNGDRSFPLPPVADEGELILLQVCFLRKLEIKSFRLNNKYLNQHVLC